MQDNKKIKLLVTILILLLCITIIKFIIQRIENYDPIVEEMKDYGYENLGISQDPQSDQEEKQIEFTNITVLKELKGNLQISTVMEKVEKTFIEGIPEILEETEDMSKAELLAYYADNSLLIKDNLNVDNEASFLNMIEKFSNLKCNVSVDYKSCEFLDDGNLKLVFSYENQETIKCNLVGEHANLIMFEF